MFSTTLCNYNAITKSLQIVAAFEFVVLLLLLLDLTLTLMWLRPQKFFTNMMEVVEVNN